MGVQRGEAPLAGQEQRPCGVWGKAPKTKFAENLNPSNLDGKYERMKIMNKRLKKILLSLTISSCVLFPSYSYAASEDIDAQIREQQRILQELNSKKAENNSKEIVSCKIK